MVHGRFSARNASKAAVSSMRLLVVLGTPPEISFSRVPEHKTAAQPPQPGLGSAPPSL